MWMTSTHVLSFLTEGSIDGHTGCVMVATCRWWMMQHKQHKNARTNLEYLNGNFDKHFMQLFLTLGDFQLQLNGNAKTDAYLK